MLDWLVIAADRSHAGRGVSGNTLYRFLRTYFGSGRVRIATPDRWRRQPVAADTIFLGLPTSLEPREFARIRCRRLAVFDYLDDHGLVWLPEKANALHDRIVAYLKPWREAKWNYEVRMGLLPIRRYGRFSAALAMHRMQREWRRSQPRLHDVAFVGRPNAVKLYQNGAMNYVEQRVEWISALRRDAPELNFWGGLIGLDDFPYRRAQLTEQFGNLESLEYRARKVEFFRYYYHLCRSRVALAPGGNVPWSYRHYEALYSGAVVATIDFREREMLVPLPNEAMVHVPDGESVVPAVREALAWSRERPELARKNVEYLEQYFRLGRYSRSRPALIERFLAQLG